MAEMNWTDGDSDMLAAARSALKWWHSIPRHFWEDEPDWLPLIRAAIDKEDARIRRGGGGFGPVLAEYRKAMRNVPSF